MWAAVEPAVLGYVQHAPALGTELVERRGDRCRGETLRPDDGVEFDVGLLLAVDELGDPAGHRFHRDRRRATPLVEVRRAVGGHLARRRVLDDVAAPDALVGRAAQSAVVDVSVGVRDLRERHRFGREPARALHLAHGRRGPVLVVPGLPLRFGFRRRLRQRGRDVRVPPRPDTVLGLVRRDRRRGPVRQLHPQPRDAFDQEEPVAHRSRNASRRRRSASAAA